MSQVLIKRFFMVCLPQVSSEGCQLSKLGIQELSPSDIELNFEMGPESARRYDHDLALAAGAELTQALGLVTP
jgi:hypothetical protein